MNLRAKEIIKEGVDLIVVDTAHGHTKKVAEIIKFIKKLKIIKLLYVQEILQHQKLQNF
jgi:IMP dehydrogenase